MNHAKKCILAGSLAGIANGLFGAGGGLILVPFFLHILKLDAKKALPTSVAVMLPLSLISACTYRVETEAQTLLPFLFGGLLGGICGGFVFQSIPTDKVRRILGILIVYSGLRTFLQIG